MRDVRPVRKQFPHQFETPHVHDGAVCNLVEQAGDVVRCETGDGPLVTWSGSKLVCLTRVFWVQTETAIFQTDQDLGQDYWREKGPVQHCLLPLGLLQHNAPVVAMPWRPVRQLQRIAPVVERPPVEGEHARC